MLQICDCAEHSDRHRSSSFRLWLSCVVASIRELVPVLAGAMLEDGDGDADAMGPAMAEPEGAAAEDMAIIAEDEGAAAEDMGIISDERGAAAEDMAAISGEEGATEDMASIGEEVEPMSNNSDNDDSAGNSGNDCDTDGVAVGDGEGDGEADDDDARPPNNTSALNFPRPRRVRDGEADAARLLPARAAVMKATRV